MKANSNRNNNNNIKNCKNGKLNFDAVALQDAWNTISYKNYYMLILKTGKKLKQLGWSNNHQIAIYSSNRIEYPILLMACFHLGIVVVPINTRLPSGQVEELLVQINCIDIVVEQKFEAFTSDLTQYRLDELVCSLITGELNVDSIDNEDNAYSADKDIFYAKIEPGSILNYHLNGDKTWLTKQATILFTSGSMGKTKAFLHTLSNHYYSAVGSNQNIHLAEGDKWLLFLPLYHVSGLSLLFRTWIAGATLVIASNTTSILNVINKYDITHLSMVATQLCRLLKETSDLYNDKVKITQNPLDKMKAVLLGGGRIPPSLIRQALEVKMPVFVSYGSTEMASQIATTQPGDSLKNLLTAGKALKHRKIRLSKDGEILVKGETLFFRQILPKNINIIKVMESVQIKNSEYMVDSDKKWLHTGDLGRISDDGYLDVLGRRDRMFISGGENIYPEEIEKALYEMKEIKKAVVVPVLHEEFGKRPVAFVETGCMSKKNEMKDIEVFLRLKLASYKVPDYFFPWPRFKGLQKYQHNSPSNLDQFKIDLGYFNRLVNKLLIYS